MELVKLSSLVEGMLFISGDEGISISDISKTLEVSNANINKIIKELNLEYSHNKHGITIVNFAGTKVRMTTRKEDYSYYSKLRSNNSKKKLSQASLEVLSIIAYKGPVTKSEIENIRGVCSDSVVYKLKSLDLIKENGRSKAAGRPFLYITTDSFMKIFNLNSLSELPRISSQVDIFHSDDF